MLKGILGYSCFEPTSPDQNRIWHVCQIALVATSLNELAFSRLVSLLEANTQDWHTFTINFLQQFSSATAQCKTQAEA